MDGHTPKDPPAPPLAALKEKANPEVTSVKSLLKLLDKAAKSARTYGAANPVAKRFFDQFYEDLTKHLETYTRLSFLVGVVLQGSRRLPTRSRNDRRKYCIQDVRRWDQGADVL